MMIKYWIIGYYTVGLLLVIADWIYYKRNWKDESLTIATRGLFMNIWLIVVIFAVYLILFKDGHSLGDYKR